MKLYYWQKELPFQYPFTISKGRTKTHQPTLIVALQLGDFVGFGEAPSITYYNISIEDMVTDIEKMRPQIEKFALTEPERYWHYLHHLIPHNPFLVSALDMACWDLFGHIKGKLLYQIWDTKWENTPKTDYTIGLDTINVMVKKMKAKPWPIYKIKLGSEDDIETIRALRKHSSSTFRIDANAGWTLEEAMHKIPILKDLGVELIEQPLAKDNWDEMKILYYHSVLPIIADESCVSEHDVEKCVEHFHGVNIKLTKCSGITPAIRMIAKAKELNMKVMMGCMNESSIGSAAIANFLPQLDYVDMDGPLLQTIDLANGLNYNLGEVTISGRKGLGIVPTFLN